MQPFQHMNSFEHSGPYTRLQSHWDVRTITKKDMKTPTIKEFRYQFAQCSVSFKV